MKRFSATRIMFCILLLFLDIPATLGCSGPANNPGNEWTTTSEISYLSTLFLKGSKGDAVNRNLKSGYGGFTPPHNVEQLWRFWLKQYEEDLEKEKNNTDGDNFDRGPGSGWPERWTDLKNGQGGAPAPPWAFVPADIGLPGFCNLPPVKGTCNEKLTRYGYNGFSQRCEEFEYSGCGENQNNFKKSETCEAACMPMPIAGCELDTMQYIEED